MPSFQCEYCLEEIIISVHGQDTECDHYPAEETVKVQHRLDEYIYDTDENDYDD